jgi:hypothetical protein
MDEGGEVNGAAIVAGGEAAEMLEAAEASLDLVTMPVDADVVGCRTVPADRTSAPPNAAPTDIRSRTNDCPHLSD